MARFDVNRIDETTTANSIAYVAGGFGSVKTAFKTLALLKDEWDIEILEADDSNDVNFEGSLIISVPHQHWDDFVSNAFEGNKQLKRLNLSKYMKESILESKKNILLETNNLFSNMFDAPKFRNVRYNLGKWRSKFGGCSYVKEHNILVKHSHSVKDIKNALRLVRKQYENNRGYLEMFSQALKEKKSLERFDVFKKYNYIYGDSYYSKFRDTKLTFESKITKKFDIFESLQVKDDDVFDEIITNIRSVHSSRNNTIIPVGKTFTRKFFKSLQEVIDSMESIK